MIFLIGRPGVGKFTIGSRVAALTESRLVDSHSVANVLFNVIAADGVSPLPTAIWPLVEQVRQAVMDTLVNVAPRNLSFVFTNYMRARDPYDLMVFDQLVAAAEIRGSVFVPVLLTCEIEEMLRRVSGEDRRARFKLVDPEQARRWYDEVPAFETAHPNVMRLDVTDLPPNGAARTIVDWARRRQAAPTKPSASGS